MRIPEKYRERYDRLAMSHPWMREMRDETNGIDGETNVIRDEITLPDGDAVAIMRKAAKGFSGGTGIVTNNLKVLLKMDVDATSTSEVLGALADMVERDYVSREKYDGLKVYRDTWENMARVLEAERDEWKSKFTAAMDAIEGSNGWRDENRELYLKVDRLEAERDEWKAKAEVKSAKRAAAVKRLKQLDESGGGSFEYAILGSDKIAWPYLDKRDVLIDLLTDEPMDAQRDSNGTCPDGDRTCPNHSKAQSKTEPSLSQLFGILSDDCGHIADMSQKSTDCVRNDGFMSENGVRAGSVDANDGNATRNISGENVTHDSREKLCTLEVYEDGKLHSSTDIPKPSWEHDSREKLEADKLEAINDFLRKHGGAISWNDELVLMSDKWLDRQAAIIERQYKDNYTGLGLLHDLNEYGINVKYLPSERRFTFDCHGCEWPSLAAQPDQETHDRAHRLECENRNLAIDLAECMEAKGALEDELRAVKRQLKQEQGMHSVTLNNWEQAKGKLKRERESLQAWKTKLDERDARAVEDIAAEQVAQYREKAEYWKARAEESWERLSAVKEAVGSVVEDMRALV